MKQSISLLLAFIVAAASVHADSTIFSPTPLTIDTDDIVPYAFDGTVFELPVNIGGTPAQVVFCVYTKDRASEIGSITNGYLGWHYVNKIDTCIYASTPFQFSPGANTVTWDGRYNDGGDVPPGDYTFYLWGFDNKSGKQLMSKSLLSGWGFDMNSNVLERDENGIPLANPVWYTRDTRWVIGGDPLNNALLLKTTISLPENWNTRGEPLIDPRDNTYFYLSVGNSPDRFGAIAKLRWIAGGEAELADSFGDGGISEQFATSGGGSPGVDTDGTYLFTGDDNHVASNEPDADFYIYDFNGAIVEEFDLTPWWSNISDYEAGGQMNGGPILINVRQGKVFLGSHTTCIHQMVDPVRYLESGNPSDFFVWTNGNGDYVLDKNFAETADRPWVCNDYNVPPYTYSYNGDELLFSQCGFYDDTRELSFGLLGPDGTGLGYFAFQGQTNGWNKGIIIVDGGTAYDGLYCDNEQTGGVHYDWCSNHVEKGIFFVAQDAFRGIITSLESYVWLKTPAGGDIFGSGTISMVTWSARDVDNVRIELSTDSGATWTTVAESIPASAGSYAWTVPELLSEHCLLRLTDTSDPAISSMSRRTFTVTPPYVKVTSPNGGEVFEAGVTSNITWEYLGIEQVAIEYSADGGSLWQAVSSGVDASMKQFAWTVPESISESCLIRLSDSTNASNSDISDAVFAIRESFVQVLSPNGGETLESRSYRYIEWNASSAITTVRIEYSTDGGSTWVLIADNVAAPTKKLSWYVPLVDKTECLVRIVYTANPEINDVSDGVFAIHPPASYEEGWLTYTTDDGIVGNNLWTVAADGIGGVWIGSSNQGASYFDGIGWTNYTTSNSGIGSDDIYTIAVDNDGVAWFGSTWNGLLSSFDGSQWTVYRDRINNIRDIVVDHDNVKWIGTWRDEIARFDGTTWTHYRSGTSGLKSGAPEILGIDSENTLWIGYKSGGGGVSRFDGENWAHYTTVEGLANNDVRGIGFTSDGMIWFGTSNGVSSFDGTSWSTYRTGDGLVSNDVYAVAVDHTDVVWFGTSNGVSSFDGDEWRRYTTTNSELKHNNVWKVAVDINNVKWFATKGGGVTRFDYQSGPYVRIQSPNGGEIWEAGSTHNITWRTGDVSSVRLEFSSDNGATWSTITSGIEASRGSYSWTLPVVESSQCLVRATDVTNSAVTDICNAPFTVSPAFVRVTSPNGSERWASGKPHTVSWVSTGVDVVVIEYSLDNGVTWLTVSDSAESADGASSYSWLTPETESETCLVRVSDAAQANRSDVSDGVFIFSQPYVTVVFPNGGETLTDERRPVIRWESDGVDKVNIDYSVDSGETWNSIVRNINAVPRSYNWYPHPVQSMLCIIRISDADSPQVSDVSDGTFSYLTVEVAEGTPEEFAVLQNTPNPFNPTTTVSFALPDAEHATVEVFNISGQRVAVLADGIFSAGRHSLVWNAGDNSAGIYFCRVRSGANMRTVKMALVK